MNDTGAGCVAIVLACFLVFTVGFLAGQSSSKVSWRQDLVTKPEMIATIK